MLFRNWIRSSMINNVIRHRTSSSLTISSLLSILSFSISFLEPNLSSGSSLRLIALLKRFICLKDHLWQRLRPILIFFPLSHLSPAVPPHKTVGSFQQSWFSKNLPHNDHPRRVHKKDEGHRGHAADIDLDFRDFFNGSQTFRKSLFSASWEKGVKIWKLISRLELATCLWVSWIPSVDLQGPIIKNIK